jgi:hypothetical protein
MADGPFDRQKKSAREWNAYYKGSGARVMLDMGVGETMTAERTVGMAYLMNKQAMVQVSGGYSVPLDYIYTDTGCAGSPDPKDDPRYVSRHTPKSGRSKPK